MDESRTGGAERSRKVTGAIRFLVNARDLKIECVRVLHETILLPVLMEVRQYYGRRRRDIELGLCRWKTSEDY